MKIFKYSKAFLKASQELKIEPYPLPIPFSKIPKDHWQEAQKQDKLNTVRALLQRKLDNKIDPDLDDSIKDQLMIESAWKQAKTQNMEYGLSFKDLRKPKTIAESLMLLEFVEDKITEKIGIEDFEDID